MDNYLKLQKYIASNHQEIEVIDSDNKRIEKYKYLERGAEADPVLVFKPVSQDELQIIIQLLNQFNCSAVIFAGNTGLVSAQRADGCAVIDVNYLDNLISLTLKNGGVFEFSSLEGRNSPSKKAQIWQEELIKWQRYNNYSFEDFSEAILDVQSGAAVGSINYVLEPVGIEVPIDMGAVAFAGGMTIGGGVANASHGTYGIMHGKASDLVIEAKSINGDGSLRLDKGISVNEKAIIDNSKTQINSAIAQYGDSAIGTQGTFAVITKVKLKTVLIPKQQNYFLIKFDSVSEVVNARKKLYEEFSNNLREFEIMNNFSTELVRKFEKDNYINPFFNEMGEPFSSNDEIDSKYLVLAEFVGNDAKSNLGLDVYEYLHKKLKFEDLNIAYASDDGAAGDPKRFRDLRHAISGASTKFANTISNEGHLNHRITPDVSVPLSKVYDYIKDIESYCSGKNFQAAIFGHISIGAFHLHIFTPKNINLADLSLKQQITEDVFSITKKYEGSCWSEHGIGTANANLYKKYTPKKYVSEWLSYKNKYDPKNVLSPKSNGFDVR